MSNNARRCISVGTALRVTRQGHALSASRYKDHFTCLSSSLWLPKFGARQSLSRGGTRSPATARSPTASPRNAKVVLSFAPCRPRKSPQTKPVKSPATSSGLIIGLPILASCTKSSTMMRSKHGMVSGNHGRARSVIVVKLPAFNQRALRNGMGSGTRVTVVTMMSAPCTAALAVSHGSAFIPRKSAIRQSASRLLAPRPKARISRNERSAKASR